MPNKDYYSRSGWDEQAWIDIIAVEYEELIAAYDFNQALSKGKAGQPIRLLDLGCGTGIFPRFLNPRLAAGIQIKSDLLDISAESIAACKSVLDRLDHFQSGNEFQHAIEGLPTLIKQGQENYDVVWAIHSFTTVDVGKMEAVFRAVRESLASGGIFYLYQLGHQSAYQRLHGYYRDNNYEENIPAYMEFEQSVEIMDALDWEFESIELSFDHQVAASDEQALEKYLQKIILDDKVRARELFKEILQEFLSDEQYRFTQKVFLLSAKK